MFILGIYMNISTPVCLSCILIQTSKAANLIGTASLCENNEFRVEVIVIAVNIFHYSNVSLIKLT